MALECLKILAPGSEGRSAWPSWSKCRTTEHKIVGKTPNELQLEHLGSQVTLKAWEICTPLQASSRLCMDFNKPIQSPLKAACLPFPHAHQGKERGLKVNPVLHVCTSMCSSLLSLLSNRFSPPGAFISLGSRCQPR